jgi:uncharacterized membrane-anchored protein
MNSPSQFLGGLMMLFGAVLFTSEEMTLGVLTLIVISLAGGHFLFVRGGGTPIVSFRP